ncbi:hypothetical protein E3N88_41746 [Mikania micrantha]|uniref:Uncharacterized protein n=1 Tax=Mikania micrantha TaxID=192012 RepID=A0A5N6LJV6_9ASTR|nr:hypothetical protein E3N88_41746 [Mikania micrantha]
MFFLPESSSTPHSSSTQSRSTSVEIIRAPSSSALLDPSRTTTSYLLNRYPDPSKSRSEEMINDDGFQRALYMIDIGQNDLSDAFA